MGASHSPLPWVAGGVYVVELSGERSIAKTSYGHATPLDEAKANAAFIVRACNSHDDLLAALKAVVAVLQKEAPGTSLNHRQYDAVGLQAHAAIDKAEGSH